MTSMQKMIGSMARMAGLHLTMLKSAKQLATLDLEQWGHWNGHLGWKSCLSVNSTTDLIEHIYFHLSGAFTFYVYSIYKHRYICDIHVCMIYELIIYVPCMYTYMSCQNTCMQYVYIYMYTCTYTYICLSKARQLPTMVLTTCGPMCMKASSSEDTALSQDR